jgi:hypothetical protein
VETVLLCDVLPDGTVAAQVLVEPVYDTNTGQRVATRTVDPATGAAYTVQGELQQCRPCARQIIERCGCDDTDGDGTGDVRYIELWAIDPCGGEDPALLGTWLDGDFEQPYTPVAPVDCPEPEAEPLAVETWPLCVVNDGDGSVVQAIRREVVYDETGAATSARYVDAVTGAPVALPAGTHIAVCPQGPECASPTTPVTSVGLCLADGTPIAVTVIRDCDGLVTSEGWLNLTTGAWTAGAVPAGTVACGDSRSIQVSGTFCDVDANGEVVGLVLVEYTYDDTGAISGVRLVDAVTGDTYTPTGTVTVCPAGVEQPEQDAVILCHTAPDGTLTQFVRDYRRDENGTITGHSDYTLDGAPYTPDPAGTVGVCAPPCLHCETLTVCDSAPVPVALDATALPDPMRWWQVACPGCATDSNPFGPSLQPLFDGGSVVVPPTGMAPTGGSHHWSAGTVRVDGCSCEADVTLTLSVDFTNDGPGSQVGGGTGLYLLNGDTLVTTGAVPPGTSAGVTTTVTVTATVPAADLAAGNVVLLVQAEGGQQDIANDKQWTLSDWAATATAPCGRQFARIICRDCSGEIVSTTDYEADGVTPYTPVGEVGECRPCTPPPDADCEIVQLCDVEHEVTAVLPAFGVADEQWQTLPNGVRWMRRGNDPALPQGWYTSENSVPERFDFDRPVSLRYVVRFNGPTAAPLRIPAGWYLDALNVVQHTWDPVTRTIAPTASATVAGESAFRIESQTTRTMIAPVIVAPQPTTGQISQYGQIAVTADRITPFLRTVCKGADGTVTTTDTAVDGVTPYTVSGTAGTCSEPPAPPCQDCETLILCDSGGPATITGTAAQGTLPNGIAWTARSPGPGNTGGAMPPRIANSSGVAFWGLHSFPNQADGPTRWTFSKPSTIEFSVYLIGSATNAPSNRAQLPAGLEVLSLPANYAYDAATGVLTRTPDGNSDNCTYVTDPQPGNMARFRTLGPVTSLTAQPGLGSRIAACGTFFTYYVGAFSVAPGGQFLRRICRDCDGQVTSVADTLLDGVTPYVPAGDVGQCEQEPPCDLSVVEECTYSMPDGGVGFDLNSDAYPGCMLATATNPSYGYGDRVTAWEGTYESSTGAISAFGFVSGDLGGHIDFAAFTPAIPVHPTQSPTNYVGTATFNGVTVTLRALAGNGIARNNDTTKLNVDNGDRYRFEFSRPVRLTLTTVGFGDPPTPHYERFCGVVVDTVPWPAVKLADCQGRIKVVDAATGSAIPARATLTCGDACCQPVQVCIQQDPVQTREFISNEEHRNDNSIDPVWKWTTDLSAASPVWYDMYQYQFSADWTVRDSDTARPAWWVSPHPDGRSAQSSPPRPGEGPSLLNTHWYPRAHFDLPANADPATIRVQATVFNADQAGRAFRLNDGAWQALPPTATHNGVTYQFGPDVIPGAKAGRNFLYLDVEETVGGGAGLMVHLKVLYQVIPETRSWTRMVCCDGSIYYLDEDGQRQDSIPEGWLLAPCFPPQASSGGSEPPVPDQPVQTGIRRVTGTAAQALKTEFPGLQSVSLTVLAGVVTVTMSSGAAQAVPAGVTLTWSVADTDDSSVALATFAGSAAAADFLLNWTYKGTAAG